MARTESNVGIKFISDFNGFDLQPFFTPRLKSLINFILIIDALRPYRGGLWSQNFGIILLSLKSVIAIDQYETVRIINYVES